MGCLPVPPPTQWLSPIEFIDLPQHEMFVLLDLEVSGSNPDAHLTTTVLCYIQFC